MTTHQQKKLDTEQLREFRDRFSLSLTDEQVDACEFVRPGADSPEMKYLHARRAKLGGYLPLRQRQVAPLATPKAEDFARFALEAAGKEMLVYAHGDSKRHPKTESPRSHSHPP